MVIMHRNRVKHHTIVSHLKPYGIFYIQLETPIYNSNSPYTNPHIQIKTIYKSNSHIQTMNIAMRPVFGHSACIPQPLSIRPWGRLDLWACLLRLASAAVPAADIADVIGFLGRLAVFWYVWCSANVKAF